MQTCKGGVNGLAMTSGPGSVTMSSAGHALVCLLLFRQLCASKDVILDGFQKHGQLFVIVNVHIPTP